jgi:adenylate kinase
MPNGVRLIIFGRQGAGKGTQCELLARHYGVPHISTGDMLRAAAQAGTPLGLEAKGFMDAGKLLPDEVMIGVVSERLGQPDATNGWLLDGFPRTRAQAEALAQVTADQPVGAAVDLDVPEAVVIDRISARRVCSQCGAIYSVDRPPTDGNCDRCGGAVIQRADDTPDSVRARLADYAAQTAPLLEYFDGEGLLIRVDGNQPTEQVFAALRAAIDAAVASN